VDGTSSRSLDAEGDRTDLGRDVGRHLQPDASQRALELRAPLFCRDVGSSEADPEGGEGPVWVAGVAA
jgi:hypothetical protein